MAFEVDAFTPLRRLVDAQNQNGIFFWEISAIYPGFITRNVKGWNLDHQTVVVDWRAGYLHFGIPNCIFVLRVQEHFDLDLEIG